MWHGSMTVSYAMAHKGLKVTHIHSLTVTHRYFPVVPETFHNIMFWRWWKTHILCNLEKYSFDNCLMKFGIKWWTMSFPYKDWAFGLCSFYTLDTLTCYHLTFFNNPEQCYFHFLHYTIHCHILWPATPAQLVYVQSTNIQYSLLKLKSVKTFKKFLISQNLCHCSHIIYRY